MTAAMQVEQLDEEKDFDPCGLEEAPLGHGASTSKGPPHGETSSQTAANSAKDSANSANGDVSQTGNPPLQSAAPTNGTSIGQLPARAPGQATGTLGPSGAGPGLSLPALPKLTPPSRTHLKPPVADVMSNSSQASDDLVSAVSSVTWRISKRDLCNWLEIDQGIAGIAILTM
eukprot:Skav215761  [mRNA]  locus=scaffold106:307666:309809:- [translate_table: standard]